MVDGDLVVCLGNVMMSWVINNLLNFNNIFVVWFGFVVLVDFVMLKGDVIYGDIGIVLLYNGGIGMLLVFSIG